MNRFIAIIMMLAAAKTPTSFHGQETKPLAKEAHQEIVPTLAEEETNTGKNNILKLQPTVAALQSAPESEREASLRLVARFDSLNNVVDSLKAMFAAFQSSRGHAEAQLLARNSQTGFTGPRVTSSTNPQPIPGQSDASTPPQETGLKLSGYLFGDYFYNLARDRVQIQEKDNNGFRIRRFYLTADNTISLKFSARFRAEADESALTNNGNIGILVKDAFLRWNGVFNGSDLLIGLSPTPAFEISEEAWGYRALEKTIIDLNKVVSARDQGVSLGGRFDSGKVFNYQVMIGNNSGTKPESDKHKRIYLRLHVIPARPFQFTLYGDYNIQPGIADPLSMTTPKPKLNNSVLTSAAFLGLQEKERFSVGLEAFRRSHFNQQIDLVTGGRKNQNSFGVSAFGSVRLVSRFSLVARLDAVDPDGSAKAEKDKEYLFIGALDYLAHKHIHMMPNIYLRMFDSLQPSVTARITLFWKFAS